MIKSILAVDAANGIGKNGTLPWGHNSEDMHLFKNVTNKSLVIMGRNTWNDPKFPKPLPGRRSIVVTSNPASLESLEHVWLTLSPNDIHHLRREILILNEISGNVSIIGGSKLFEATLSLSDLIYVTRFQHTYDCDTFVDLSILDDEYDLRSERVGKCLGALFQSYTRV